MVLDVLNRELDLTDVDTFNSSMSKVSGKFSIIRDNYAITNALRSITLQRNAFQEAMMLDNKHALRHKNFLDYCGEFNFKYQRIKSRLVDEKNWSGFTQTALDANYRY